MSDSKEQLPSGTKEAGAGHVTGRDHEPTAITLSTKKEDDKSAGVRRIEAVASVMTIYDRVAIYFGIFLVAYAYGLDGVLRIVYEPVATASFEKHSLLATVKVVRAVIGAAAQPTAAKVADIFGRVELICLSVVFYVVGTIIEAASTNMETFVGGSILYQIGYTMIMLLVEVVVADISSTRARLLFSYIPATPFIINTWVSGNVSAAVLASTTWQWGIGMWCIIYTACSLPLIISLSVVGRRARKRGLLADYRSHFATLGPRDFLVDLFWRLDAIGVVLMIAVFALLLVPLTLAGGFAAQWRTAKIIAPLVVGFCTIPAFAVWELKAPHPLVPFKLMKDRGIWGPLALACLLNFAWYMQGDYLYTVLIVAFDFDVAMATRLSSFYSFFSTVTGFLLGFVVFKVRRLKVFIVAGTVLFLVAFGLLIRYRGDADSSSRAGVIGAQVLLGVAGGMFPYPAQASMQTSLRHEHVAVMTGIYLALYSIGNALGGAVSGAIWTQVLPGQLSKNLDGLDPDLAVKAYADPFDVVGQFPMGTPERDGIVEAYKHAQRILTITGICLCVPLIAFSFALRNPKLNDKQNLVEDWESKSSEEPSVAPPRY